MSQIKASVSFDEVKGSATVSLELAGTSEMEHELLAQFFSSRSVSLVPFHVGDQLESRFVISQPDAYAKAQRAVENRIRARDGRPSIEDEEAAKAASDALQAKLQEREDAAHKAGFDSYAAQQASEREKAAEDSLAANIAARLAPKPPKA